MTSTFELLRWRLLLNQLDKIENAELHARVIREAEAAEELAGATPFPCLLFPCLFEERVEALLHREARQARYYWRELNPSEPYPTRV